MKRTFFTAVIVFLILSLTGCGHDHNNSPQIISTSILSDPAFDGDIALSSGIFTTTTIAQGFQSLLAGIDTVSPNPEYRAFLDFDLTGPGGVPGNAIIDSAVLDIFINNIAPATGTIPMRIDLIPIQSTVLSPLVDYNSTPLASISIPIFQSDFNQHVSIDVTSLMVQAQNLTLSDFRIRILTDSTFPGLIEINDTTATVVDRNTFAPLLQVSFF